MTYLLEQSNKANQPTGISKTMNNMDTQRNFLVIIQKMEAKMLTDLSPNFSTCKIRQERFKSKDLIPSCLQLMNNLFFIKHR